MPLNRASLVAPLLLLVSLTALSQTLPYVPASMSVANASGLEPAIVAAPPTEPVIVAMPASVSAAKPVASLSRTDRVAPSDPLAQERKLFIRPAALTGNINFWRKVFAEYSENQSVIHDSRKPDRIYDVLDFRLDAERMGKIELSRTKNSAEISSKARIEAALRRAATQINTPEGMDDEARRLAVLFAGEAHALIGAADNIRAQRGLRERTRDAMAISGEYMPEMERIFADEGMPKLLTRLPFVESSFNVNAYSKVAAAGLWQFMPSSARSYMRFNHIADERRDPWTSTRAAAQHLKDDYKVLQNWPLAVTAYNYGRGGLIRALKETGGNSLEDLLQSYESKRFGFASRNFYAEFLAASDVERDYRKHFGDVQRRIPVGFETVTITRYTPWHTLARLAGNDEEAFRKLNPAYRDEVVNGKLYVPAGDSVRVPVGRASAFKAGYEQLSDRETFSRQRELFFSYRVGKNETLVQIAKRYGVSERRLRSSNSLKRGKLRAGQSIRVPNDLDDAPMQIAKADAAPVGEIAFGAKTSKHSKSSAKAAQAKHQSAAIRTRTHKVQSGQNLSLIAKIHQTTVKQLLALNGLTEKSKLKPGMQLKLPTG